METFASDTGFEVICSGCLQYKSLQYCKTSSSLSKAKIKKFLIRRSTLLKSKIEGEYVCNLCFEDIKMDKFPKRSHKDKFKFAHFPNSFMQDLKKRCIFKKPSSSSMISIFVVLASFKSCIDKTH